ncbi:hypothetical protein BV898_17693 [Hypsibius exemplaris]|uniref:Uncharacterized protein n=1 Tax=Hypsibius exemplaris TaxID=2072580 RepID=A0A9X6NP80_HYPEX|nr:hypothetical protein BV898_17693 [Hypsibius exemplaris]
MAAAAVLEAKAKAAAEEAAILRRHSSNEWILLIQQAIENCPQKENTPGKGNTPGEENTPVKECQLNVIVKDILGKDGRVVEANSEFYLFYEKIIRDFLNNAKHQGKEIFGLNGKKWGNLLPVGAVTVDETERGASEAPSGLSTGTNVSDIEGVRGGLVGVRGDLKKEREKSARLEQENTQLRKEMVEMMEKMKRITLGGV